LNRGRSIEDLVENLCHTSFFADFTIRSPKYYKLWGQEKEAADLLIVFAETLLAIQIKSKHISLPSTEPSPIERSRVSKAIGNAIKQFRALSEALKTQTFRSFINGRGVEVAFSREQVKELMLIVVFVPVWDEDTQQPKQFRFTPSCESHNRIPTHLFSLEQFSLLLRLLDTLPDFLFYLASRRLKNRLSLHSLRDSRPAG
jgi:hypothetical protein